MSFVQHEQPILSADISSFDDPLAMAPDEPRYTFGFHFIEEQAVEQTVTKDLIISICMFGDYCVIGRQSGLVALFLREQILFEANLETEISAVALFEASNIILLATGTIDGRVAIHVCSAQEKDHFSKELFILDSDEAVTALLFLTNDILLIGTSHGMLFKLSVPPHDFEVRQIYEAPPSGSIEAQRILQIIRSNGVIYCISPQELALIDPQSGEIFIRMSLCGSASSRPVLHVDGDLVLLGCGSSVRVLLLRMPIQQTIQISPLTLGVLTALNYVSGARESNVNCDPYGATLDTVATFGESVDLSQKQPHVRAGLEFNPPKEEKVRERFFEEITEFQLPSPSGAKIFGLCPCGEAIAVLSLTPECGQTGYIPTKDQDLAAWMNYTVSFYKPSRWEGVHQSMRLQILDLFGNEQYGCILDIDAELPGTLQYLHLDCSVVAGKQFESLPYLHVTTGLSVYTLTPVSVEHHILYLLLRGNYLKAILAILAFKETLRKTEKSFKAAANRFLKPTAFLPDEKDLPGKKAEPEEATIELDVLKMGLSTSQINHIKQSIENIMTAIDPIVEAQILARLNLQE